MWKAAAALFGFLSLIAGISGAFVYVHKSGIEQGRNQIRLEQTTAAAQSLIDSQKGILEAFHDLQKYETEIANTPSGEIRPSDPLLRNHYRLRREQLSDQASRNAHSSPVSAPPR